MFDDFDLDDEDDLQDAADHVQADALLPPRETPILYGHKAQEDFVLSLYNQGRMPHALILAGGEGIGKSTFAFRLARFLLKHGKGGAADDAGGGLFGEALPKAQPDSLYVAPDDSVFRQVASGGHPDLFYAGVEMDEKKGRMKTGVSIETIRRIPGFMRMTASYGGWRVAIIDDADSMTRQAQNGILKILEEPPDHAILLLVAHRPGMFLPTIRSRCRTIHFKSPDMADFSLLTRRAAPGLDDRSLKILADMTDTSPGRAIALSENGGLDAFERLMILLDQWPNWSWPEIHGFADNLAKPGQEGAYESFADTMRWVINRLTKTKAEGLVPEGPLARPILNEMISHYPLVQWLEICEQLGEHFDQVQYSSLDRRHGVIGAFALLGEAR